MIKLLKRMGKIILLMTVVALFIPVIIGIVWIATIGGFNFLEILQHKIVISVMVMSLLTVVIMAFLAMVGEELK